MTQIATESAANSDPDQFQKAQGFWFWEKFFVSLAKWAPCIEARAQIKPNHENRIQNHTLWPCCVYPSKINFGRGLNRDLISKAIQDAAEMLQDGTVQDGSKKPALHLKTFLNAYKALSRGVVHLFYYTQACATPSFGSRVISFPSTQ